MTVVLPVIVAAICVWLAFTIVVWATDRDPLLDIAPGGATPGLGEEGPVGEAAVAAVRFDTGLRGYRTEQVDAALDRLAWEIGRRDEQIALLRAELGHPVQESEQDADSTRTADEPLHGLEDLREEAPEATAPSEEDPGAAAAEEPGSEAGRGERGDTPPRGEA